LGAAAIAALVVTMHATAAHAEVTGAVEGGATATSGNTSVETYVGSAKAAGTWAGWGVAAKTSGVYGKSAGVQTAGAWDAGLRGDRVLKGWLSTYVKASIEGDEFKGLTNRKSAGLGLSGQLWKRPGEGFDRDLLRAELGYQFLRDDLSKTDEDIDIHAARAFVSYVHAFTKETTFTQDIESLSDVENEKRVLITSITALSVKLRANLAFKASETVKADLQPNYVDPADHSKGRFKAVDTITSVAFILSF
jgi:hypothetical protein